MKRGLASPRMLGIVRTNHELEAALQRYRDPGLMFLAAIVLVVIGLAFAGSMYGLMKLFLIFGLCTYATAALWWIVRAARPAARLWPHLLAVWVPAIVPVGLLAWSTYTMMYETDAAAMVVVVLLLPAYAAVFMCGAGTIGIAVAAALRARLAKRVSAT